MDNGLRPGAVIKYSDLLHVASEVLETIYYTLTRVGVHYKVERLHKEVLADLFRQKFATRVIDFWPTADDDAWKSFDVEEHEIALMVMVVRNHLAMLETVATSS